MFAARPGGWTHRLTTFGLQPLPGHERFSDDGRGLIGTLRADNNTFLLDLDSGWYDSLILDRPPSRMGLVPGTDWIWFAHPHPLGSLSLLGVGQVVAAPEYDPLAGDDRLAYFQLDGGLEIDELLEGLSLGAGLPGRLRHPGVRSEPTACAVAPLARPAGG